MGSSSDDETDSPPFALDPDDPLGSGLRTAVARTLDAFLADQRAATDGLAPDLDPLHRLAGELTGGGKRLRPALCVWGWVAAAGPALTGDEATALLRAATGLELLHVSALVHDDVMDGSDLRRGVPSAHRQLERWHRDHRRVGDPEAFGRAGAILLGDLLLMWSVEMLQRSGFAPARLAAASAVAETMRTEVTGGQFLDVLAQTDPLGEPAGPTDPPTGATDPALAAAERVTDYKSARYTIVRPAQLGATLAGGGPALLDRLERYGRPLGRAFQYRDDLLGVFGDPELTGKPAGDDLREGKRTVLVAHTRAGLSAAGRAEFDRGLGDPTLTGDGIARLQHLIIESGAVERVETMIGDDHARAVAALDGPAGGSGRASNAADSTGDSTGESAGGSADDSAAELHPVGRQALIRLARIAVERTS